MQNSDELTVQSTWMPSVPPLQDYPRSTRKPLHAIMPRLIPPYHSCLLLVRSLLPRSFWKRRSLQNATWLVLHSTEHRKGKRRHLGLGTLRVPSARSVRHASRIGALTRTRP